MKTKSLKSKDITILNHFLYVSVLSSRSTSQHVDPFVWMRLMSSRYVPAFQNCSQSELWPYYIFSNSHIYVIQTCSVDLPLINYLIFRICVSIGYFSQIRKCILLPEDWVWKRCLLSRPARLYLPWPLWCAALQEWFATRTTLHGHYCSKLSVL